MTGVGELLCPGIFGSPSRQGRVRTREGSGDGQESSGSLSKPVWRVPEEYTDLSVRRRSSNSLPSVSSPPGRARRRSYLKSCNVKVERRDKES